jgi:Domain of unknown function (DUF4338)
LRSAASKILNALAEGAEIDPAKIDLQLTKVVSETREADVFRLASLTWSVPVSAGFGRMRYLVWNPGHDKLVGIFTL